MAEFKEVMRQKERMCTESNCNGCPIVAYFDSCLQINPKNAAKYEELVMQWAKEHPEPQYPSFEEWQKENFPNAGILICYGCFGRCLRKGNPHITCEHCRKQPIPADIAEKLGIRPKEAEA